MKQFKLFHSVLILLFPALSFAQNVCSSQSFQTGDVLQVEKVEVRLVSEADFSEVNKDSVCVFIDGKSIVLGRVDGSNSYTELDPLYPKGTEFRITVKHLYGDSWKFDDVFGSGNDMSVYYADEHGGSSNNVVVVITADSHFEPIGNPASCDGNVPKINSLVRVRFNIVDTQSESFAGYLARKLYLSHNSPLAIGDWEQAQDYENVEFKYSVQLRSCIDDTATYDASHETYIRFKELQRSRINLKALLSLEDDMWPHIFKGVVHEDEKGKVEITDFKYSLSYGERESIDGQPTSSEPTGIILRIQGKSLVSTF